MNALADIAIPSDISPNAHSIVLSSYYRNQTNEWIQQNRSFTDQLKHYFSLLVLIQDIISFNMELKLVLDIEFEDGSTAIVEYAGLDSNGQIVFQYQEGSARDASGNSVPENTSAFYSVFIFNDYGSYDSFLNHARLMGIPVVSAGHEEGIPTKCEPNESGGLSCEPDLSYMDPY